MNVKGYRESYLAGLVAANSDLETINEECDQLELRKRQLEGALGALEPFLRSATGGCAASSSPKQVRAEQPIVVHEREALQPISRAPQAPEPVVPASFSTPDAILDPIQHRINRALGLAVA